MPATWFRWLDPWRRAAEPSWLGPLNVALTLSLVLLAIFTDGGRYESGRIELFINLGLCLYAVVMVLEMGGWHLPRPLFFALTFIPIAFAAYVGRDTIVPLLAMSVTWWITYTRSFKESRIALLCALASILPPFIAGRGTIDNFFAWSISLVLIWVSTYALVSQRRTLAELRQAQVHLARQAAVDERRRLAREVHDVVAHSLAITLLHITGARHILARDPQRAAEALAQAETLGRASLADLRRTIGLLTTDESTMTAPPTAAEIPALIETFVQAGVKLDYTVKGDLETIPAGVGLDLYRLIQEALTNVTKHGAGGRASLYLVIDEQAVNVEITNPMSTTPIPSNSPTGRGLEGMRERVTANGGRFVAGNQDGMWSVTIWLPLSVREPATTTLLEKAAQP